MNRFNESDSVLSLSNVAAGEFDRLRNQDTISSEGSDSKKNVEPRSAGNEIAPVGAVALEYQSALLEMIEAASNDPRQIRSLVYELARTNLVRETWESDSVLTLRDVRERLLALEKAIARVEVGLSGSERTANSIPRLDTEPLDGELAQEEALGDESRDATPRRIARNPKKPVSGPVAHLASDWPRTAGSRQAPVWPRDRLMMRSDAAGLGGLSSLPAERPTVEIVYPERDTTDPSRLRRGVWLWFIVWPFIQLIGPAIFCVALYVAIAGRLDVQSAQRRQSVVAEPQQSAPDARASGLPLPSTYGVYAISNGQLSELQPLPIRAPDPRVQLSAEINKPSATVLADGKIAFVLFERGLLNSAPERIAVRVVARVASAVTFSAGKAAASKPDSLWRIRSNSFDLPVSPLNENREMVVVRSENPDFTFPAGRYALVIGGLAYDFTVEGRITDPAQCLESFEAVNGPVFTPCRPK